MIECHSEKGPHENDLEDSWRIPAVVVSVKSLTGLRDAQRAGEHYFWSVCEGLSGRNEHLEQQTESGSL